MEWISQKSPQTRQTSDRESFNSTLSYIGSRLHLIPQEKTEGKLRCPRTLENKFAAISILISIGFSFLIFTLIFPNSFYGELFRRLISWNITSNLRIKLLNLLMFFKSRALKLRGAGIFIFLNTASTLVSNPKMMLHLPLVL